MRFVNEVARWVVNLVLAGGLVWAVAVWRSRRRTAALVAVACALQLAIRLLWIPGVRLLFGPLSNSTNSVQHFLITTAGTMSQLALAVSLDLLVFAALDSVTRKPWGYARGRAGRPTLCPQASVSAGTLRTSCPRWARPE
jgi:hypothetical protein